MKKATIREAQHHLSKLLREVEAGEEIVLTRRGKEVATLAKYQSKASTAGKVDWGPWVEQQEAFLAKMPKVAGSPVLEERESYRS